MNSIPQKFALAALLAILIPGAPAQVVINEVSYASSDRVLQYAADGTPSLGYAPRWPAATFIDTPWLSGNLPAGWGSTVNTNTQAAMQNKTPSLYLRKTFTVTGAQATSTQPLVLQVDYDDGFAAYLNGVEVARYNCGGAKHFMYAGQTAYNVVTTSGVTEVTLGAANTLLLTGANVLAIEVRNKDLSSNFRINAGLKLITSTVPISVTKAFYDNNAANGASRTHTNTNGVPSNTPSGTPPAGGWLATAADPVSDNLWTSLQIVTAEQAGVGLGGSGAIRYTITQSGTNRSVYTRAPSVDMTNAWVPGGIASAALASTTVKFRYRTTGDLQFGFRFDPGVSQAANSVDGYPVIGLPVAGAADYDWTTASGGTYGNSVDAAGNLSTILNGSINIGNYELNFGPGVRSGQVQIIEDNTAGAGPGGTTGTFSWLYTTFPSAIDSLGFGIINLAVTGWPAGAISAADFQKTRLSFRWKMPAGRTQSFYLENNNGYTDEAERAAMRANIGTFTGTGNWESYSVSLSNIAQAEALRTKLNNSNAVNTKLTGYYAGGVFANGEAVRIDNLNIYYETAGAQLDENTPNNFSTVTGATRTRTINGAGGISDTTTGTLVNNVALSSDAGAAGFIFAVIEDNTAGAGNGSSTGFVRLNVSQAPTTGAPFGFSLPGVQVRNWTAGAITTAQLSNVSLQFAAKVPSGVTFTLYAEPVGGSLANRANLGTVTGNGTWQTLTREFNGAGNVDAFRTALNTAVANSFQLTFVGPSNPVVGDQISIDDVQVLLWRSYQITMNQGSNQQRFLDNLNGISAVSFIPTFVKNTAAPAGGGTFIVDDFQVDYNGADPNAFQALIGLGASGGAWKYFVGLYEPSGGLADPVLSQNGFPIPPGQEDEYDNPQSFRDWVELRNLGGSPVALTNWSLSDDSNYPEKWKFPTGATIPANGYLIVMCDDRNEANGTATYLHTNFTLPAGGKAVRLYDTSVQLQSAVTNVPSQDSFHTWGRLPDGTGAFGFLDIGTPAAANAGNFATARVDAPDFIKGDGITDFPGGFYTGAQTLILTCTTSGAQIRYTTDGSDPTETTGTAYAGPITLTPPADAKSALNIRTRAFKTGLVKSNSKTHSYLLSLNANLKGVPAMLVSGDAGRTMYVPNGVMAIVGGTYPSSVWTANGPASYNIAIGHGDYFERAIHAEWYYPDGKDGWREEVGVRLSSSPYSRPYLRLDQTALSPWIASHDQKPSFSFYWRGDYGNSTVKDPNLIPGNDVNDYSRLRLRAGKNDIANPFILDEMARRLYRDMGWVQPTGTINTFYVNGSFKGMFNMCERLRGPTFALHYRSDYNFDVNYIGEFVDGDNVFWLQMQTALNNLNASPTLANYQAVQNYLDPVNVADYFLHNIYVNNNDWPNNNYAAHRERSPAGRFRMAEWDVEGAFGLFGQGITYDTIDDKLLNISTECGDIFKRLYQSPEFKLLFADRIQKHMWNGGVLDDRGSSDHFQQIVDSLTAQVQPLMTICGYGTINLGLYTAHVNPTTGRRVYLFGTGTGNFRSKGLWPVTEPPSFSQFGGTVPSGYQLVINMTAPNGSVIYYTLDGSDPRLPGGGISGSALVYSGPVTLNSLVTVNARVRNTNGEWSAINSAYFEPNAQQPTAASLVMAEVMYNPPAPSYTEEAATYTNHDSFEFVRLTNISATPLDLRNLRFTTGITFDFSTGAVLAINPGASVLVVANKDAFQFRYGTSYSGTIAGEYGGQLSNSGEQLILSTVGATPATIANFIYGDAVPWPEAADGYGASMMLALPATAPNPALPASWVASAQTGGMPGGVTRTMTYTAWKNMTFDSTDAANAAFSGQTADPEGDGVNNLLEYTLGGFPRFVDRKDHEPIVAIENFSGQNYVTLTYTLNAGASDAIVAAEVSGDLATWSSSGASVFLVSGPTTNPNGSVTRKVRDATATTAAARRYIRLKTTGP